MIRKLLNLLRRHPPQPKPVILVPTVCIQCGRGCGIIEQDMCLIVHLERQRRDAEHPNDRGHDGLYA